MELGTKLKLDLHVHVFEEFLPPSPRAITVGSVERIIEKIKAMGLDGIAVTEHDTKEYGYRVKQIVETKFNNEVIIIPGREVETFSIHYIELDLPWNASTFRFLAHPGYPGEPEQMEMFHGIEIRNAAHNWHINQQQVMDLAAKHNLILLSNSDAHYLRNIGMCYSEISPEDLSVACSLDQNPQS
ncbi:MAG: PHP domain-containing protein [Chloroflexi bacterium]|nr:PHP domain-containing protein [Chloroflexota bacterium]